MDADAYGEMADTEERHWWFTGRRAILRRLIAQLPLPAHARILEIGSGTGGNLRMLESFGRVSAMEVNDVARSIAMSKTGGSVDIRAGRCPYDIPFRGERFDLICLFDVLEHIREDTETLAATRDFLAEGGRILITVPAHQWLWSHHDVFLHHQRRYSAAELRRKCVLAGLQPLRISYFNTVLFPLTVVVRAKAKLFGERSLSGREVPPPMLNSLLFRLFSTEGYVLERADLPFGVSLVGVLRLDETHTE